MRFILFLMAFLSDIALAGALTNAQTYGAQYTDAFRNGTPGMMIVKGQGTNTSYMLEADPATGALPVNIVSGSLVLGYDENYGTVGATTLRTAAQIGNATGAAAFGAGATSAQTLRVVLPTDQTAIPASQSGTWDIRNITGTVSLPTGASTEATLAKLPVAQGSTTSGESGPLIQGAVTTAAPSYTTAQTSPLSLTTGGALRVDASGSTQPVSGTVAATQSGTWTVQPGNTANTTAWLVDQAAATTATFQDGSIAFGSLTTSFATVITSGGALKNVSMRNNTNGIVVISLDGGSTTAYTLDSGDAITIDLKPLGLRIPVSTALQAKYSGSAPTSGSIRINGVY